MSLPDKFWTHTAYQASDSALRCPLVFGDGLRVGIESDATGGMSEQLLCDFDIRAAGSQENRVGWCRFQHRLRAIGYRKLDEFSATRRISRGTQEGMHAALVITSVGMADANQWPNPLAGPKHTTA